MKLIGLTGGIAAGKSTIAGRLAAHGATILDADLLAREVVEPGTAGLAKIRRRFGDAILTPAGELDRPALGRVVFGDPAALEALNGIVHPEVRDLATHRIREIEAENPDAIVVYDVPLIVESGLQLPWDMVVVAEAPADVRIGRLVELRGMSRYEAENRVARQASDAERRAIADVVIDTGGTEAATIRQADELWARLVEESGEGQRENSANQSS